MSSLQGRRVGTLESLAIFDHVRTLTPSKTTFSETEFFGRNSGGTAATNNCALIGGVLPNQAAGRYLGIQFGLQTPNPTVDAGTTGSGSAGPTAQLRSDTSALLSIFQCADFEVWIGDILAHRAPIRQYGSPGVLVQGLSSNWADTGATTASAGVVSSHYSSGPALEHQIGANQIIRVRMFPRNGLNFPQTVTAATVNPGALIVNCSIIVAMATGVVVQ